MSPASYRSNVLTPAIAEQFLQENSSVSLDAFTDIEDAAARILARHRGILSLHGLERLSEAAAKFLAAIEPSPEAGPMGNSLRLGRLRPTPTVARHLATYRGDQIRFDREAIDLPFVEALATFRGNLWLGKVTHLDDQVAAALANRAGSVYLDGVQEYGDGPGHLALARALVGWGKDDWLGLRGLRKATDGVLLAFAGYNGKSILLEDDDLKKRLEALQKSLVQQRIERGALTEPDEWQGGRIVPTHPPRKPLRGRGNERTYVSLEKSWWLSGKVCDWFVRKLDSAHKISGSDCISPEAATLLRQKGLEWFWLMQRESNDAKEREAGRLNALPGLTPPTEFRDGAVRLPPPARPVAEAHCWKVDFAGEHYPAVLNYYNYLPAEHVGSITDPNGYPAKAMSPEAAALYREHRAFWEAKHAELKAKSRTATKERQQATKQRVAAAASTAGLSRQDLEAKLDRLGEIAAGENLRLAAEMIAGFGEPWLYQALLAGATITPEGELKPGKALRRFGQRAELVMLLAIATMPEGVETDPSVRREATMRASFNAADVEVAAEWLAHRIPQLQPSVLDPTSVEQLSPSAAAFLARGGDLFFPFLETLPLAVAQAFSACKQGLNLFRLRKLEPGVPAALAAAQGSLHLEGLTSLREGDARALSAHVGQLCLGLEQLPAAVAAALAPVRGPLQLPLLQSITPQAAAALAPHRHLLELGSGLPDGAEFRLDAAAARHLAKHHGPLSLPKLKRLPADAARALTATKQPVRLEGLAEFPDGEAGVRLCEKILAEAAGDLLRLDLERLQPECATVLARSKGELRLEVKDWSDAALIALAAHRKHLSINPREVSAEAGRALGRRPASSELQFCDEVALSDEAAEALGKYRGQLSFCPYWGSCSVAVSPVGAAHLAKRPALEVQPTKLKPAARKVLAAAGQWDGDSWTRRA